MFRIDNYERKGVEWPYNFVYTVFEKAGMSMPKTDDLPMDIERAAVFVISGVPEKRGDILFRYYKDHKTVSEIATELGITKQSVSFDIRMSIERIARSNSRYLLEYGIITLLTRRIRESYEAGYTDGYFMGVIDGLNGDVEGLENATIEELNLSVRSFNCLCRAGYRTAEEVASLSAYDICKIRNLGRRSAEEIYGTLTSIGIKPRWNMDSYDEAMAQINAEKYFHKTKQQKE